MWPIDQMDSFLKRKREEAGYPAPETTPLHEFLTNGGAWKRLLSEPGESAKAAAAGLGTNLTMGALPEVANLVHPGAKEAMARLAKENPVADSLGGLATLGAGMMHGGAPAEAPLPERVPSSEPLFKRLASEGPSMADRLAAERSAKVDALIKQATTDPNGVIKRSEMDPAWAAEQAKKTREFVDQRDAANRAAALNEEPSAQSEIRGGNLTKHERQSMSPTAPRRDSEVTRPILSDITATIKRLLGGGDDEGSE